MENQPAISSDLIRGHIDTIILHTLLESDKFAQQISDSIESKSENEYKINQATLYSSLKRLETLKLVSSYWHDYDDGRRKYFKITDSGKKTVESNLSSWSYSRSVIDKLMNLSPTPVYETRTVYVKTEQKPVETAVPTEKSEILSDKMPKFGDDTAKTAETADATKETVIIQEPNENERNFRNILNGLIQISARTAQTEQQNAVIEPITDEEENKRDGDVLKFNETIRDTDYNANKSNFNGKIDYGDLTLKAEKEGYVLRISSKDSAKPVGKFLPNKLNFIVSILVFLAAVIELGALYLAFSDAFNAPSVIVLSALPFVPLAVFSVIYLFSRNKLSKTKAAADGILISAIVAFNLILVTFAIDFLFELDFSDAVRLLAGLVIPIVYYLDIVLFFALRFALSSKKAFSVK